MHIEIKHRLTGKIIHEGEYADIRAAVEVAKSSLSYADLSSADLRAADLSGADLSRADLSYADLSGANLSGAVLSGANLSGAVLRGAVLRGANLSGADLSRADLRGADLSRAVLSGAVLSRADLSRADLSCAVGINPYRFTPLLMLLDQVGKVHAYKLVNERGEGPQYGGITYEIGKTVEVADACTDVGIECAKGISLATLDWCMREWCPGYRILLCEFTAKDIAAIPTATDGKFRVFRCKVVRELDLVKIGLVKPPEPPKD